MQAEDVSVATAEMQERSNSEAFFQDRADRKITDAQDCERIIGKRNRVAARFFRGVDDLVDPQIAFAGRRCADAIRLVGHADVESSPVGLGIDGDGGDPHFVQRAGDANGDFAAVRDEDLLERFAHATFPNTLRAAGKCEHTRLGGERRLARLAPVVECVSALA